MIGLEAAGLSSSSLNYLQLVQLLHVPKFPVGVAIERRIIPMTVADLRTDRKATEAWRFAEDMLKMNLFLASPCGVSLESPVFDTIRVPENPASVQWDRLKDCASKIRCFEEEYDRYDAEARRWCRCSNPHMPDLDAIRTLFAEADKGGPLNVDEAKKKLCALEAAQIPRCHRLLQMFQRRRVS